MAPSDPSDTVLEVCLRVRQSGALRVLVALVRIILDLWAAPPQCGYWGCLSLCFNHGRLLSALSPPWRKTFGDYILDRKYNEEKKETKKNSPGYLSLSCAPLGNCRLSLGLWYQAYDSGT